MSATESGEKVYPVDPAFSANALLDNDTYLKMYQQSIDDPDGFWSEQGNCIDWMKPFTKVKDVSYSRDDCHIRWFEDGTLNVSVNCLDRHLAERGDEAAIIWEGDDPEVSKTVTYNELYAMVCKLANGFKEQGVKKGDVVTLYMPMIPEAAAAMLACARIGAVHSIVFGGFSPEAIAGRIDACDSKFVITADEGVRGGRNFALKGNVDKAVELTTKNTIEKVFVIRHTGGDIDWVDGRDVDYKEMTESQPATCEPEEVSAEDPLFILYTSGSTGTPKGVLHTSGGYLVYATLTFKYIFDYQPGDIYWCTADVGWITGHTYMVYGPLSNGATSVLAEGLPNYPDSSRIGKVVDKHSVNILYTAPTAIRSFMKDGRAQIVENSDRSTLKVLGSVGEPINPEAWEWYHEVIGNSSCPIVDTYWQTETGGVLITPLPGATDLKPGSATRPFFGVEPAILDENGKELEGATSGNLVIKDSWPGQMRTVYGDHERFVQTYFTTYDNVYTTGDGARRDEDGYYWITGRTDDVLNVSGHRLGTAEIESALVLHKDVAEAAVVGFPHDIKGQAIYVYVTLKAGVEATDELKQEMKMQIRKEIGPIASPDVIQWAPGLPKTRSGKIMRRILRKIASNETDQLGDTSTLADPSVVDDLIANRG